VFFSELQRPRQVVSGRVGSSNDLIKKSPYLKGHGSNHKCKTDVFTFLFTARFYVFNILLTFCNVVIFTNVGKCVIIKKLNDLFFCYAKRYRPIDIVACFGFRDLCLWHNGAHASDSLTFHQTHYRYYNKRG